MRRRQMFHALLAAPALGWALDGRRAAAAPLVQIPFSQDRFAAAQAAGKPILVDVWASWCPTCAKQAPTLAAMAGELAFRSVVVFRVDFDAQKDVARAFGAQRQSTLIVFRGTRETGRAVGQTDPGAIRALVASALLNEAGN